uniref:Uncharacterized protein n=1 Tax=Anguilla anguilla TaxID=7936 RepID=A0A0E9RK33_ANGAN
MVVRAAIARYGCYRIWTTGLFSTFPGVSCQTHADVDIPHQQCFYHEPVC